MDSLRGRLLLSSPSMNDLNFDRTVVYLLEHSVDGALGVVLNRPTDIQVLDAIPYWAPLASEPPVLFLGGPVARGSVIAVGACPAGGPDEDFTEVSEGIGVLDVGRGPDELAVDVAAVRFFTGYSGWSSQQLELEIEAGAWLVVDADSSDPFDTDAEGLWTRALRRDTGQAAMVDQGARSGWLN